MVEDKMHHSNSARIFIEVSLRPQIEVQVILQQGCHILGFNNYISARR